MASEEECVRLHLRPLPPPGQIVTLFGTEDRWAQLRADFDRLVAERPQGGYRLILSDWPWLFSLRSKAGEGKAPQAHYDCIPIDVIRALPVWKLAANDSITLQWSTSPLLDQQIEVMKDHGFVYKQEAPWLKGSPTSVGEPGDEGHKAAFSGGYLWRNCHEPLLIGTRGEPELLPARRSERAAFYDARREHSRKPDDIYRKAETLCAGPYLELFSRSNREGWTSFGNQSGLFGIVQ